MGNQGSLRNIRKKQRILGFEPKISIDKCHKWAKYLNF